MCVCVCVCVCVCSLEYHYKYLCGCKWTKLAIRNKNSLRTEKQIIIDLQIIIYKV